LVRITTHRATPFAGAFVGHLEQHFRHARQIVQHPPETAFNIVGITVHHPSETPFTLRRNTHIIDHQRVFVTEAPVVFNGDAKHRLRPNKQQRIQDLGGVLYNYTA